MTFKHTQKPRGSVNFFCGISFGKKPINNKIFEERGKLYMRSLAFTPESTLSEKKKKP